MVSHRLSSGKTLQIAPLAAPVNHKRKHSIAVQANAPDTLIGRSCSWSGALEVKAAMKIAGRLARARCCAIPPCFTARRMQKPTSELLPLACAPRETPTLTATSAPSHLQTARRPPPRSAAAPQKPAQAIAPATGCTLRPTAARAPTLRPPQPPSARRSKRSVTIRCTAGCDCLDFGGSDLGRIAFFCPGAPHDVRYPE